MVFGNDDSARARPHSGLKLKKQYVNEKSRLVESAMCKHLPTTGDIFEMSPVLGKCLYTIYGQAFA